MERMVLLLAAARDQGVVPCRRRRRVHLYGGGQVSGSVMHHLGGLAPIEVGLLARRMLGPAGVRLLVAASGGAQRIAPAELRAQVAAIGLAVVDAKGLPVGQQPPDRRRPARGHAEAQGRDPAGVLLGSGKLATELDRLDLIDEYKFLIHPRIAGHGPTLYQSGLPSTRRLELVSANRSAAARSPCTTGARADSEQPHRAQLAGPPPSEQSPAS
jgi:hypothetical protein